MTSSERGGDIGEATRDSPGHGRSLVVLPTYNEAENIEAIVPEILDQDPRLDVLVVDDGSPDGTGELADRMAAGSGRVSVLHRPQKMGLGSAYLAGFSRGLQRGYERLLEMDADFSHPPRYLRRLLDATEAEDGCDLAVGSRYLEGVNVVNWPMGRLLLSYYANKYARWVTGIPLTDLTSGFKCFRREVLEAIDFEEVTSTGYAFQIEMNTRAWHLGFEIREVSIIFMDRDVGESKMSGAIVREAVWKVWALRLKAILGRL